MIVFQLLVLLLVGAAGTAVVITRDPSAQPIGISYFGLILAVMFMLFQAPDVALSQLTIGAVGLPLMILLALARLKRNELEQAQEAMKQNRQPSGPAAPQAKEAQS